LINFARRFVGETETAENLVQDVFLKIWEHRAKLNPELNIKTYLYTAVRNQAFNYLRHLNVKRQSAEHLSSEVVEIKSPDNELAQKELAESIQAAVSELPEKRRIIFSMNRFDGLTYAEIAEIQNISIKTVETQMGRALQFLRKRLAHFLTAFPL
jgi:RNA polymerase sigma-70 factor (ECF subfamily)